MKKVALFFFVIMLSLTINAQHLKFMGIPIDGNINTFASKLASKGFSVSQKNKNAGVGLRILKGRFYDRTVELWIEYTPSTKTVYCVQVLFDHDSKTSCESLMKEIKNSIQNKYLNEEEEGKTKGGHDITIYHVYENKNYDTYYLGDIYTGISRDESYYSEYNLRLTYEDGKNRDKNYDVINDDI